MSLLFLWNNVKRTRRMGIAGLLLVLLAACGAAEPAAPEGGGAAVVVTTATAVPIPPTHPPLDPTYAAQIAAMRDPTIPDLPFPDNPDPSLCGIPTQWGDDGAAWITGMYAGELAQDPVLLYESHLRLQINGRLPHGAPVQVILYQQNPETDYYFVKGTDTDSPVEGWVPAPFLSFAPVAATN